MKGPNSRDRLRRSGREATVRGMGQVARSLRSCSRVLRVAGKRGPSMNPARFIT
jgi:hypothetical protein